MPFREKKAWVTISTLLVVFIPYFYFMVDVYHRPDPDFFYLGHLALIALAVFIVMEVALVMIARTLSPEDRGIPLDEREQFFAFRAARIAYVSLIVLTIMLIFPLIHTYGGNWGWGMSFLGAIIISEIIRGVALIVQYRRDY